MQTFFRNVIEISRESDYFYKKNIENEKIFYVPERTVVVS
jgi:hypothetical protein